MVAWPSNAESTIFVELDGLVGEGDLKSVVTELPKQKQRFLDVGKEMCSAAVDGETRQGRKQRLMGRFD